MVSNFDYAVAALAGFFAGIFLIPTLLNLGLRDPILLLGLPWAFALIYAVGIYAAEILSRRITSLAQFSKFLAVGFLNTTIDFGVLNLLSLATGITSGLIIGGVNIPGFAVAVVNSYFWNKYWVFRDREGAVFSDAPRFLAVTGSAALLNSGVIAFITETSPSLFGLSPELTLNIVKAGATVLIFLWNFFGFKLFVFRSADGQK